MTSTFRRNCLTSACLAAWGLLAQAAPAQQPAPQPAAQPPAGALPAPQPEGAPEPKFGDVIVIRASGAVVNRRPGWTYYKYQGRWVATRTWCQ